MGMMIASGGQGGAFEKASPWTPRKTFITKKLTLFMNDS
jgi:hypothetical protein